MKVQMTSQAEGVEVGQEAEVDEARGAWLVAEGYAQAPGGNEGEFLLTSSATAPEGSTDGTDEQAEGTEPEAEPKPAAGQQKPTVVATVRPR